MKNEGNDLSITELLKKLREQADAAEDPEEETAEIAEPVRQSDEKETDEGEDEIRAALSRILGKLSEEENDSSEIIAEEIHFFDQESEESILPEESFLPIDSAAEKQDEEPEDASESELKDLILRLNRQAAETAVPQEAEAEETADEESVILPVQEQKTDAEEIAESIADDEPAETPETEADSSAPAPKSGGTRYHFSVTKKTSGEEVAPSPQEYEAAKQDIADFSEEKSETKEAPSFSGWKMLKNIFGFGKEKGKGEEAVSEEEPEMSEPLEEADAFGMIPEDDGPFAGIKEESVASEETEKQTETAADTAAEEAGGETEEADLRADAGAESPAVLFYASNRSAEHGENDIAPDPELFEKIREEYPIAMNDPEAAETDAGEDTRIGPEEEKEEEPALSDGDLDQMMHRFLTKENYEEYSKDADLDESRRRMRQISLDDPENAEQKKAEKKGDTKEIPSAPSPEKTDESDAKLPLNSIFDSETFVPPEIEMEEEGEGSVNKDISILVAFGREEEARKKYGDERIDAFLREISGSAKEKKEEPEEDTEYQEDEDTEYENFGQNKELFRNFKKKYRLSLIRMVLCGVLLLLTFFLENYDLLGLTPIAALDPELFPLIYVMADLQLLLFGCLLVRDPIVNGAKALLRREPDPSVFVTVGAVFCFLYSVFAAFLPAGKIRLYTFPLLLLCFVSILCGFFDLRREIMTFRVVSSKRTKYVIGSLSEEEATLEEEAFENYLPEEPMLFKLGKANFIDGFFRRSRKPSSSRKILLLVPPFACAIGLAFLGMSVFFGAETGSAVTVGITTLMMSLPAAMLLTYSYPFYTAASHAYDTDSAIIGEASLDEYCDAASVSFEDSDVFPSRSVKVRSVMVFGENRIDEVINNVTSVFHVAGGPLSDVLDIITSDLRPDEDTRLLSVAPDGIEADVSGTHMYLGKADYLRRNHYEPVVSDEDREIERSGSLSIMYVVSDDEVVAKFYLNYRIDPDFEKILKQMYRSGICVGIKTFDPNIDDDMLSRRIRIERYPVRVLKCREIGDEPRVLDRADSGIVSKHSTKALLGAFAVCGKVQTVTRIGIVLNFISLFAAAMVMGVTMLFGAADRIASLYVALYQLFWTIPVFVMSRLHVKQ